MVKFLILGAGMTGLSTAFHLKKDYFLAEREEKVGGLSGSIEKNGFIFDYAEHFLRIPSEKIEIFFKNLMGDKIFSQELKCAIYFKEKFIQYPFQENLRDIPINELKKCASSLIKNYFYRDQGQKSFSNFEEFIYYQYGEYIANEFMIPYNKKIWSIEPSKMNTSWFLDPNFLPSFDLEQILSSILPISNDFPLKKNIRWYPVKGGSQELSNGFLPYLNYVALNHEAKGIDLEKKVVTFQNGISKQYEYLINTIPIPKLIDLINPIPTKIKDLKKEFKYNSVHCMNLCLKDINKNNYHWLYFPQEEIPFSRLFFSDIFSIHNSPPGSGTCSALVTYLPGNGFNEKEFQKKAIEKIIELNFIRDDNDILDIVPLTIEHGFAIPTLNLDQKVQKLQDFLIKNDIYSIGRYGEWKYAGIEHAINDGEEIAQKLLK